MTVEKGIITNSYALAEFDSEEREIKRPPTVELAPGPILLNLAGATTLAEASDGVDFTIRLPTYPADLGPPDQVYLQKPAEQAEGGGGADSAEQTEAGDDVVDAEFEEVKEDNK